MKKIILTITTLLLTQTALAAKNPACELPYDLAGTKDLRVISIDENTRLTPAQKKQVKIAALRLVDSGEDDSYLSTQRAIQLLKESSSGSDLSYIVFSYKKTVFTEVVIYPGDNAYGVIFYEGKPAAELHDGDVVCIK